MTGRRADATVRREAILVRIRIGDAVETLSWEEWEARVRSGRINASTLVQFEPVTGQDFVRAGSLQMYLSLRAEERRAWQTGSTIPLVTALLVGVQVRVWWFGGGLSFLSGFPGVETWLTDHWLRESAAIFEDAESFRLLTMGFFHTDPLHILSNMVFMAFAAYNLERTIGRANLVVLYVAAVNRRFVALLVRRARDSFPRRVRRGLRPDRRDGDRRIREADLAGAPIAIVLPAHLITIHDRHVRNRLIRRASRQQRTPRWTAHWARVGHRLRPRGGRTSSGRPCSGSRDGSRDVRARPRQPCLRRPLARAAAGCPGSAKQGGLFRLADGELGTDRAGREARDHAAVSSARKLARRLRCHAIVGLHLACRPRRRPGVAGRATRARSDRRPARTRGRVVAGRESRTGPERPSRIPYLRDSWIAMGSL